MPGSPILRHSGGVTGSCHGLVSLSGEMTSVLTARSAESAEREKERERESKQSEAEREG